MGLKQVNLVVTCTKRKTQVAHPSLCIGSLSKSKTPQLVEKWIAKLEDVESPVTSAFDLYSGDHWKIAKSLPCLAKDKGVDLRLWVCSAGYGLVSGDAAIKPYSATFSSGHVDSILGKTFNASSESVTQWWSGLSKWRGPVTGQPRTLRSLAQRFPNASLVVAASGVYLSALEEDIASAKQELASQDSLVVVSGTGLLRGDLATNLISCDARLQNLLGGALMSLNIRIVRWLLETTRVWPLNVNRIQTRFRELVESQPPLVHVSRTQITDEQVADFIKRKMRKLSGLTASPLLRSLRDSGFACEQKRFGRIFKEIREVARG